MTEQDKRNKIAAIVCLIVIIISIPYALFSSMLLGVMIGATTMMVLFLGGSFTLAGISAIYHVFKSIKKKKVIHSKKGKKIQVKAYIFLEAVMNLIIMAMALGSLGLLAILWIICVILNLTAGFVYQSYTEV